MLCSYESYGVNIRCYFVTENMSIVYFIGSIYGLLIGSFFNVCISRIPKGLSIVFPASNCPKCKTKIRWFQNIPVFSYLYLRGRCATCKTKISIIYPLIEILTVVILLIIMNHFSHLAYKYFIINSILYFIFFGSLLISSFIDLRFFIIPDRFTIGGIFFGILVSTIYPQLHGFRYAEEGFIFSLTSCLICFSILNVVRLGGTVLYKREAMGFGDIKLVGAFGAFLGWKIGLLAIFLASIIGSVFGVGSILFFHNKMRGEIPFGPYLSMGAFIAALYGKELLTIYYKLLIF